MRQPNPKQRGPNLSLHETCHKSGESVTSACCGEMLVQVLWESERIPGYTVRFTPENAPGPIFCRGCGHKAGRQVTRLLKQRVGKENIYVGGGRNDLFSNYFTERERINGKRMHVTYRYWEWVPLPEEDLPERPIQEVVNEISDSLGREATDRLLSAILEADRPQRRRKRLPRRTRERRQEGTVTGRVVVEIPEPGYVGYNVSLPNKPRPPAPMKSMPTDMMLDGNRWVIKYTRGNGLNWYVALDRNFWTKDLATQVRNLVRESAFQDMDEFLNTVVEFGQENLLPYAATVISKDLAAVRRHKFPPVPEEDAVDNVVAGPETWTHKDKVIIQVPFVNGGQGFLCLNKAIWSMDQIEHIKDLARTPTFASIADLSTGMRKQCEMMDMPHDCGSWVVNSTVETLLPFKFKESPMVQGEMAIPEDMKDIPF